MAAEAAQNRQRGVRETAASTEIAVSPTLWDAAAADQSDIAVAQNGSQFFAVWSDWRTFGPTPLVYGARFSANGELIDATGIQYPIAADHPLVAWNGDGWLVVSGDKFGVVDANGHPPETWNTIAGLERNAGLACNPTACLLSTMGGAIVIIRRDGSITGPLSVTAYGDVATNGTTFVVSRGDLTLFDSAGNVLAKRDLGLGANWGSVLASDGDGYFAVTAAARKIVGTAFDSNLNPVAQVDLGFNYEQPFDGGIAWDGSSYAVIRTAGAFLVAPSGTVTDVSGRFQKVLLSGIHVAAFGGHHLITGVRQHYLPDSGGNAIPAEKDIVSAAFSGIPENEVQTAVASYSAHPSFDPSAAFDGRNAFAAFRMTFGPLNVAMGKRLFPSGTPITMSGLSWPWNLQQSGISTASDGETFMTIFLAGQNLVAISSARDHDAEASALRDGVCDISPRSVAWNGHTFAAVFRACSDNAMRVIAFDRNGVVSSDLPLPGKGSADKRDATIAAWGDGFIVSWSERVFCTSQTCPPTDAKVRILRLDSSALQSGAPVDVATAGRNISPAIATTEGLALLVWLQGPNSEVLRGVRVTPDLQRLDPVDGSGGVIISQSAAERSMPAAAWDGTAFDVVWQDTASETETLRVLRASPDQLPGVLSIPTLVLSTRPLCANLSASCLYRPAVTATSNGAVVFYQRPDPRVGDVSRIFMQAIATENINPHVEVQR